MWKCPKCGRKFARKDQPHSCRTWPIDNHFKNKEEVARPLFNEFKARVKKNVGQFKIRSLHCCIHLVSDFSFVAVFPMKDKIRLHFSLDYKLESQRIGKRSQFSKNRYMYSIDLKTAKEMDAELMKWLKQAYNLRNK